MVSQSALPLCTSLQRLSQQPCSPAASLSRCTSLQASPSAALQPCSQSLSLHISAALCSNHSDSHERESTHSRQPGLSLRLQLSQHGVQAQVVVKWCEGKPRHCATESKIQKPQSS